MERVSCAGHCGRTSAGEAPGARKCRGIRGAARESLGVATGRATGVRQAHRAAISRVIAVWQVL